MSTFKKGDQVRLIHSKDTGTVIAILPDQKIRVLIDDILEMELPENELCHTEPTKTPKPKTGSTMTTFQLKDGIYFGISLAKTGFVEVYLLNHTAYSLVYAAFRENEQTVAGRTKGEIAPRQTVSMYSIRNAELEAEGRILFQWLTFSTEIHKPILPQSLTVKLAARYFRKEPQAVPGIKDPLILIPVQESILE